MPILQAFFPDGEPGEVILNAGVGGAPLRFPLSVWFSRLTGEQRESENQAIASLAGSRSGSSISPWYGVVIVLKYGGTRCTTFIDITRRDLMILIAYLRTL